MKCIRYWYTFANLVIILGIAALQLLSGGFLYQAFAGKPKQGIATTPIQHVVVIMMENHTLDNYFGRFSSKANGVTLPRATDPAPLDFNHNGAATAAAIDKGAMD